MISHKAFNRYLAVYAKPFFRKVSAIFNLGRENHVTSGFNLLFCKLSKFFKTSEIIVSFHRAQKISPQTKFCAFEVLMALSGLQDLLCFVEEWVQQLIKYFFHFSNWGALFPSSCTNFAFCKNMQLHKFQDTDALIKPLPPAQSGKQGRTCHFTCFFILLNTSTAFLPEYLYFGLPG